MKNSKYLQVYEKVDLENFWRTNDHFSDSLNVYLGQGKIYKKVLQSMIPIFRCMAFSKRDFQQIN